MALQKFKDELKRCTEETGSVLIEFPWANKNAYADWLAQTFYMVSYSTRLVALAGAETSLDQESLHKRFVEHSMEEQGHPVLCIRDLKNLGGFKIEDFKESMYSAFMYQTQYYWIREVDPAAFYGYAMALEDIGARYGHELYKRVADVHPASSASFLKVHAHADHDHVEEGFVEIEKLTDTQIEHATTNLVRSNHLYKGMLLEIIKKVESGEFSSAA